MQHMSTILNKIAHTCEKSAIEIDVRENIQEIFIATLSYFTQKNSQERKQISYRNLKWEMLPSFLHSVVNRNTSHIFSTFSSGSIAMQNPNKHHIFGRVSKSDKLKGAFQRRNVGKFSYF